MSTEFQPPRKNPARGILFASSPASAGRDKGVPRPPKHLTSPDRTDASGQPPISGNADGVSPSLPGDVPAIGLGPTLGGISSGGATNDQ